MGGWWFGDWWRMMERGERDGQRTGFGTLGKLDHRTSVWYLLAAFQGLAFSIRSFTHFPYIHTHYHYYYSPRFLFHSVFFFPHPIAARDACVEVSLVALLLLRYC